MHQASPNRTANSTAKAILYLLENSLLWMKRFLVNQPLASVETIRFLNKANHLLNIFIHLVANRIPDHLSTQHQV
jgi:hypothetical protein